MRNGVFKREPASPSLASFRKILDLPRAADIKVPLIGDLPALLILTFELGAFQLRNRPTQGANVALNRIAPDA